MATWSRRHVPAYVLVDPANPKRIYIAISAARRVSHRRRRRYLEAHQQGLNSPFLPDPGAEVGHCVHHVAFHRSKPDTLFMQKHWDVMRSDNAGDSWHEVSGNLPTDFGFVIDVHAHEPETIYVVPIKSDGEHYLRMENCASTAAAKAATNGKRSRKACRRRTATSTSCATRWPWIRWTSVACILALREGRCTARRRRR